MVRLKVTTLLPAGTVIFAFQFHYGTIKGLIYPSLLFLLEQFQFHYGTIKGAYTSR